MKVFVESIKNEEFGRLLVALPWGFFHIVSMLVIAMNTFKFDWGSDV